MYKVVLVDDEKHAREGLNKFVDWQQLNTQVCAQADDGVTALPLLQQHRPDILVTDVRMRQMDGIELARQAKDLLPELAVIFLSGYNDPEYLQNAVRLSAADYLYKPVTPEEFTQVMQKVVRELDAARQRKEQLRQMRESIRQSCPILRQAFLSEWLDGAYEDPQDLVDKTLALDFSLTPGAPLQSLVFLLESPLNSLYTEEYLLLHLRQLVESGMPDAAVCTQARSLAIIRQAEDPQEAVPPSAAADIAAAFHAQTDARVSVAAGLPVEDWTEVPLSYQDALSTLENRYFSQQGEVLSPSGPSPGPVHPPARSRRDPLVRAVRGGDKDALFGQLYDIGVAVHQDKLSLADARMVYLRFILWLEEELGALGLRLRQGAEGIRALANAQDYQGLESSVHRMVMDAVDQLQRQKAKAYSPPVRQVIRVLETEYAKRLTIDDLAQRIHYSPGYLCDLFKGETQRTIGEYLLTIRMEKALDLLKTSDKNVLGVAQSVGYGEQTHFTRLFKRFTGLTPLEYRRRVRG